MFDENVRNTFFHSDDILYQDEFRSKETNRVYKIPALVELMNRAFSFYQVFMELYFEHITSYKVPKKVLGRIHGEENPTVEVELTVHDGGGLSGFRSPPVQRAGEQSNAADAPTRG